MCHAGNQRPDQLFTQKFQPPGHSGRDLAIQTDPASKWYDLVLDGKLIEENLHTSGKDRTWLNTQLSRAGIGQLSETFYAACDNQDNFFACRGE